MPPDRSPAKAGVQPKQRFWTPAFAGEQGGWTSVLTIFVGAIAMAAASQIDVPMVPVPMTLQTLAIVLLGALAGARLGTAAILLWLLVGAVGLPVFAGGASGLDRFTGPTAGYLVAFPIASAVTGLLVARGWTTAGRLFAAALVAHAICLLGGAAWLSTSTGWMKAMADGVVPFVVGAAVKSAIAVLIVRIVQDRWKASLTG